VARVVAAQQARKDLTKLIATRTLPADTRDRVRNSLAQLETFPRAGRRLQGQWRGFRAVLGPWPWMILVYQYDERTDTVTVDAIHDSRSASAATVEG
jgi:mRNA-degrading endonuclease YafQ of YafQ-DinJ toxin-antitoxin module